MIQSDDTLIIKADLFDSLLRLISRHDLLVMLVDDYPSNQQLGEEIRKLVRQWRTDDVRENFQ